eukprot:GHVH01012275.1.p1 GENE.GHVH01012275.1~~GHVH01012275.1.p1  ORF type:complete len:337 (-),score=42.14 GHVH01012275.1:544-1554(-)
MSEQAWRSLDYPGADALNQRLEKLCENEFCHCFTVGRTVNQREIRSAICGTDRVERILTIEDEEIGKIDLPLPARATPAVLLTGLHHAREVVSATTVIGFLEYYLECKSPICVHLKSAINVIALPLINPDGLIHIEESGLVEWRKNYRPSCPSNPKLSGVDLNRNYSFRFDDQTDPCSGEEYSGSSAFSEPETRAVRRIAQHYSLVSALNFHTFGDFWTHPYNCCESLELDPHARGALQMFQKYLPMDTVFSPAPSNPKLMYETSGEADDYLLSEHGIISLSPEVGPEALGFWPPNDMIKPISDHSRDDILEVAFRTCSCASFVHQFRFSSDGGRV